MFQSEAEIIENLCKFNVFLSFWITFGAGSADLQSFQLAALEFHLSHTFRYWVLDSFQVPVAPFAQSLLALLIFWLEQSKEPPLAAFRTLTPPFEVSPIF